MMDNQLMIAGLLLVVLGLLARVLYWRVPANTGYIRDGAGRKRVLLEGGGLVIPGVHKLSGMRLDNFSLTISARRQKSVLTIDPLRVDVEVRLLARIKPTAESVLIAQEVFDGEVDKIQQVLEERCYSVIRSVVSGFTLKSLLCNATDFELQINEALSRDLAELGIEVMLCSIVGLDQTNQLDYQRSKSMDAKALTVLESLHSENVGRLHAKLRETELQIKALDYEAAMKQLEWEEKFVAARLEHQKHKAEIEARLAREIKEIEVSKQIAIEMIEHDVQATRLQQMA
ncbi:MAG: SPFH domain-containing protein [Thiolinea sp.]